jgi:hypothetical protein
LRFNLPQPDVSLNRAAPHHIGIVLRSAANTSAGAVSRGLERGALGLLALGVNDCGSPQRFWTMPV